MEKAGIAPASLRFAIYGPEEGFGFSRSIEPSSISPGHAFEWSAEYFCPSWGFKSPALPRGIHPFQDEAFIQFACT